MSLNLDPIDGYPTLGGSVTAGTDVGTATGETIVLLDAGFGDSPGSKWRNNSERTISVTFTRDTLVNGSFTIEGRVNPANDDAWGAIQDLITGQPVSSVPIEDGDDAVTFNYRLAADYREIRVNTTIDSGTVDIDVALGS